MDIISALKSDVLDLRINYESRWLLWDSDYCEWEVYERIKFAKTAQILVRTNSQDTAIDFLIKGGQKI